MSDDTRADRLSQAESQPFRADSLVGSFFLGDGVERSWQGCVIAEPVPGTYLVETFEWVAGFPYEQCLVRIEDMADWSFYDTAQWMREALEHGVRAQWDAKRERVGTTT